MKKLFSILACTVVTVAFAQNTRAALKKTISTLYSDIDKKCNKDFDLLEEKYKVIAEKSPNRNLSKADEAEYNKQFKALQSSYTDCINKSTPQKIEKLKSLLEQIENENKVASEVKNNVSSSAAQSFSQDLLRKELINVFSDSALFQNLDTPLKLTFNFDLDKDGIIKNIKVAGTDNEEVKLYSVLKFYSILKVFLPEIENGVAVKKRYSQSLTFAGG